MNIASQAQTLLNEFLDHKTMPKWVETLVSRDFPKLVMGLLVLLVASQAADLTWRLIPLPESADTDIPQVIRAPVIPSSGDQQEAGLESVAALHLFGEAGVAKPAKGIEKKAPKTRLNLTLHGVFVEEDASKGAAIIGTTGGKQDYFKVGATVMNGVTLQGVFNDRVVLSRNGRSEVLPFPRSPTSGTQASSARSSRSVSNSRQTSAANTSALRGYREVFQKEPLKIFEHVRFVPVRSRDGLKGYRVLPQKNRQLYNQLGIRPSDLVTAVNGVTLSNDREAMKLMQTLQDATTLQVEIVRKGQPQSLTFNLN
jgi:general secretion pathway protein C